MTKFFRGRMHLRRITFYASMYSLLLLISSYVSINGQTISKTFSLPGDKKLFQNDDSRPLSNSAVEFLVKNDSLWVGGGKGLDLTTDGGRTWKHFMNVAPFGNEDLAAVDNYQNSIWVSLAGTYKTEQTNLPEGKGLVFSTDNGVTWTKIAQPKEPDGDTVRILEYGKNKIRALAITTTVQNITYDIAVTKDAVWIASFAGGLRKSTDNGTTWEMIVLPPDFLNSIQPSDTLNFDLSPVTNPALRVRENLNHRVFSVLATNDSTLWVGTAAGINLSTDGGVSWKHFSHKNQAKPISGDFVVALGQNFYNGQELIWASTINAVEPLEFRAVSMTSDGGKNWATSLRGEFCRNFGFKDSITYAVSGSGLFRSDDAGKSWTSFSNFIDSKTKARVADPGSYAVTSQKDTIWVATADGLIKSIDSRTIFLGSDWTVFRAYQNSSTTSDVYTYPNPFSALEGVTRIHYKMESGSTVSIRIFNFAMEPVRTVINKAPRAEKIEHDEIWDGRDDRGRVVANAVYYVRVQIDENDPVWSKVMVLQ